MNRASSVTRNSYIQHDHSSISSNSPSSIDHERKIRNYQRNINSLKSQVTELQARLDKTEESFDNTPIFSPSNSQKRTSPKHSDSPFSNSPRVPTPKEETYSSKINHSQNKKIDRLASDLAEANEREHELAQKYRYASAKIKELRVSGHQMEKDIQLLREEKKRIDEENAVLRAHQKKESEGREALETDNKVLFSKVAQLKSEKAALEQENRQYKENFAPVMRHYQKVKSQLAEAKTKLGELYEVNVKLTQSNKNALERGKRKEKEVQQIRNAFNVLQKENELLKSEIEGLKDENPVKSSDRILYKIEESSSIKQLIDKVTVLGNENAQLKANILNTLNNSSTSNDYQNLIENNKKYTHENAMFKEEISKLKEEIYKLNQENNSIKISLDNYRLNHETIQNKNIIDSLRKENEEQKQGINSLIKENHELKNQLDDNDTVPDLKEEIKNLNWKISTLNDSNKNCKDKMKQLSIQIEQHENENEKQKRKIDEMKIVIEDQLQNIQNQNIAYNELQNENATLKDTINSLNRNTTENANLMKDNEKQKKIISELENKVEKYIQDIIMVENERNEILSSNNKLLIENEKLTNQISTKICEIKARDEEIRNKEKEIEKYKRMNKNDSETVAQLTDKIVSLTNEIFELKQELMDKQNAQIQSEEEDVGLTNNYQLIKDLEKLEHMQEELENAQNGVKLLESKTIQYTKEIRKNMENMIKSKIKIENNLNSQIDELQSRNKTLINLVEKSQLQVERTKQHNESLQESLIKKIPISISSLTEDNESIEKYSEEYDDINVISVNDISQNTNKSQNENDIQPKAYKNDKNLYSDSIFSDNSLEQNHKFHEVDKKKHTNSNNINNYINNEEKLHSTKYTQKISSYLNNYSDFMNNNYSAEIDDSSISPCTLEKKCMNLTEEELAYESENSIDNSAYKPHIDATESQSQTLFEKSNLSNKKQTEDYEFMKNLSHSSEGKNNPNSPFYLSISDSQIKNFTIHNYQRDLEQTNMNSIDEEEEILSPSDHHINIILDKYYIEEEEEEERIGHENLSNEETNGDMNEDTNEDMNEDTDEDMNEDTNEDMNHEEDDKINVNINEINIENNSQSTTLHLACKDDKLEKTEEIIDIEEESLSEESLIIEESLILNDIPQNEHNDNLKIHVESDNTNNTNNEGLLLSDSDPNETSKNKFPHDNYEMDKFPSESISNLDSSAVDVLFNQLVEEADIINDESVSISRFLPNEED
ncbi:hypothetical protein TRFO_36189 [Tritrichomonas foetus]|uniref:Uncharacterized protein n=1 Tax=Tritrichomonas foetus TaxID=1144522 RepID=A0A1J4JFZ5_9EUKA|nr:hypothetical protein TRFO_36189 [Tritrichomonas foetus]|eukprot:OHS97577.1 hypothetical protein TRFO_36189 [Tritrichomonas foetus]